VKTKAVKSSPPSTVSVSAKLKVINSLPAVAPLPSTLPVIESAANVSAFRSDNEEFASKKVGFTFASVPAAGEIVSPVALPEKIATVKTSSEPKVVAVADWSVKPVIPNVSPASPIEHQYQVGPCRPRVAENPDFPDRQTNGSP